MTKEEIYEKYWKRLVEIKRVYRGYRAETGHMYLMHKAHAEQERDELLEKYGHDPFSV